MSTHTENSQPGPNPADEPHVAPHPGQVTRIAVGVDGHPEGLDAVVLGAAIARATDAELMLVAVHPQPFVVVPPGMDWKSMEKHAHAMLVDARDSLAPHARIMTATDLSVPRALQHVVQREHRDLLVLGSSRHAPEGKVRIGKRARQLLCHFESALAIAPRGLHQQAPPQFKRIGVGWDGGPEAEAALALAGSIAAASGAALHVLGVVDDRVPALGRPEVWLGTIMKEWQEVLEADSQALLQRLREAAEATGAPASAEVQQGRPANALLKLSTEVDLMVVGSRRWGQATRVLLGSTGEALMHDGRCPVLVVPRPRSRGRAHG